MRKIRRRGIAGGGSHLVLGIPPKKHSYLRIRSTPQTSVLTLFDLTRTLDADAMHHSHLVILAGMLASVRLRPDEGQAKPGLIVSWLGWSHTEPTVLDFARVAVLPGTILQFPSGFVLAIVIHCAQFYS